MKIKMVKVKDINPDGPVRTPVLPTGFIKRVEKFKKILEEVEKTTLEQTLANFQQDRNPEKELAVWERIATAYQDFIKVNPNFRIQEKKETFKILLCLSMGMVELEDIEKLNREQIQHLKSLYFKDN